jgi:hypothetical protein
MPTPLDRALHQRVRSPARIEEKDVSSNAEFKKAPLFAFGAIVTGIAAWSIWGSDIFPSTDPSGGRLSSFFLSSSLSLEPQHSHLDSFFIFGGIFFLRLLYYFELETPDVHPAC